MERCGYTRFQHRTLVELWEDCKRVISHHFVLSYIIEFYQTFGLAPYFRGCVHVLVCSFAFYFADKFTWIIRGCYFQEGPNVKMDMRVDSAYQKALETVVKWIHHEVNTTKTQVFFRTYAPVHFRYAPNTRCNMHYLCLWFQCIKIVFLCKTRQKWSYFVRWTIHVGISHSYYRKLKTD